MRILTILTLVFLVSCGDDETVVGGAASCSPTKPAASLWTNVDSGNSFDLRGTVGNVSYYMVVVDDGICDANDGEFTFEYDPSTLTYYRGDCNFNLQVTADYEINCQNELRLYNFSDGVTPTQLFR